MQPENNQCSLFEVYLRFTLIVLVFIFTSFIFIFVSILFFRHPAIWAKFAGIVTPILCRIAGITVKRKGFEKINWGDPYVMLGNHQSMMDFITYGTIAYPRAVTVGKKELLYIPIFGLFYYASGNIVLDRSKGAQAKTKLLKAVKRIHEKKATVFIFPEGTRNKKEKSLLPFKKGAFYLAIEAQTPVVCLTCSSLSEVYNWERKFFAKKSTVTITCSEPISTKGMTVDDVPRLMEMCREMMLKSLNGEDS